jgi:hypothetical protein
MKDHVSRNIGRRAKDADWLSVRAYWIPAFAGMTVEDLIGASINELLPFVPFVPFVFFVVNFSFHVHALR